MAGKDNAGSGRIRRFERRATPQREVYLLLQHVAGALNMELGAVIKPLGVTPEQYHVLRIIQDAEPDGLPCSAIAERAVSGDPDVTRLLDRLERQGWASRSRDESDRRVVIAGLTRSGARLLKKLEKLVASLHARQFETLSSRERVGLRQSLNELRPGPE